MLYLDKDTWKKWAICQALVISIKSFNKTILNLTKGEEWDGQQFYCLRKEWALSDMFCTLLGKLMIWLTLMKFSCLWNWSFGIARYFSKPTKPTADVDCLSTCVSVDVNRNCAYSAPQRIWLEVRSAQNRDGGIMSHWRSSVSICVGEGTVWA